MIIRKGIAFFALLAAGAGVFAVVSSQKREEPPNIVSVVRGDISEEVLAAGVVDAAQSIELKGEAKGRVTKVHRKDGAPIKRGEALIEIRLDNAAATSESLARSLAEERTRLRSFEKTLSEDTALLARIKKAQTVAVESPQPRKLTPSPKPSTPVPSAPTSLSPQPPAPKHVSPAPSASAYEKQKQEALAALEDAKKQAREDLARVYAPVPEVFALLHLRAFDAVGQYSQELFSGSDTWLAMRPGVSPTAAELRERRANALSAAHSLQSVRLGANAFDYNGLDTGIIIALENGETVRTYLTRLAAALDVAENIPSATASHYKNKVLWSRSNIADALAQLSARRDAIAREKKASAERIAHAQWYVDFIMKNPPAKQAALQTVSAAALEPKVQTVSEKQARVIQLEARIQNTQSLIIQQKARINALELQNAAFARHGGTVTVASPIDGNVLSVSVTEGAVVGPGTSLATIGTGTSPLVRAVVPEDGMGKVAVGNPVQLTFDEISGERFGGRVTRIEQGERQGDRVLNAVAYVALDTAEKRISSGMTATVAIIVSTKHNAVLIPNAAVFDGEKGVFVKVYENGETRDVPVALGIRSRDGQTEVLTGVSEGQKLLVESSDGRS